MIISAIVPMDDHVLFVQADDGANGLFDVKPFLHAEAFEALRDHTEFLSVHNGGYFIEWPCGADLSADTVEAHLSPAPQEIAQRIRLDRASEASRDLNRPLDEPGVEESRGRHRKHLP